MRSRYYMEGLLGLLSLLGFVGIFTEEKYFLSFFAFAVDFEYFFIQTDEMMEGYMDKAAARAFYCDMFATGVVTAGCILFGHSLQQAMLYGVCTGWGLAVAVQALLVAYYRTRESLGQGMIHNRIKEYRARRNMKQEELAQLVGVRRETIGNLEKGRYNPSLVLAWNIAKVFEVPIEEIFTVEDD